MLPTSNPNLEPIGIVDRNCWNRYTPLAVTFPRASVVQSVQLANELPKVANGFLK